MGWNQSTTRRPTWLIAEKYRNKVIMSTLMCVAHWQSFDLVHRRAVAQAVPG